MKKITSISFIFLLLLLCLFGCSSNNIVKVDDTSFFIKDPRQSILDRSEKIYLTETEYSNNKYSATVSGTICIIENEEKTTKNILSEHITFTQHYGPIWKATLHTQDQCEYEFFAFRSGKGKKIDQKTVKCGEITIDAIAQESYQTINYIIVESFEYLAE